MSADWWNSDESWLWHEATVAELIAIRHSQDISIRVNAIVDKVAASASVMQAIGQVLNDALNHHSLPMSWHESHVKAQAMQDGPEKHKELTRVSTGLLLLFVQRVLDFV